MNGQAYPGGGREAFVAALLEPTLAVGAGSLGGKAVSVQSVPVQELSYIMELPTSGRWRLNVSAPNIKEKIKNQPIMEGVNIPIEPDEAGNLRLEVRGLPNNAIFADLVEAHEDVHVGDMKTAIDTILKPWDTRLSNFRNQGTQFEGMTEETATARLYRAAGGTPREVAVRFADTLRHMGNVFHQTEAGKAPTIVNIDRVARPGQCAWVYLYRAELIGLHEQRLAEERNRRRRERRAYQAGLSASLARPVTRPTNIGNEGNAFITNDML
jgi:hypothetical protein